MGTLKLLNSLHGLLKRGIARLDYIVFTRYTCNTIYFFQGCQQSYPIL